MSNAFVFFYRSLLVAFFGSKAERIAIESLLYKFSYRYTEVEMSSFLSPLRYLKASLVLLWRTNKQVFSEKSEYFAYDLLKDFYKGDNDYLQALGYKKSEFVFREDLNNTLNIGERVVDTILMLPLFIVLLPVNLLKRDKAKTSLLMLELTEAQLLGNTLKKCGAKEILIFSAFEKDIMFLSLYLKKQFGIKVSLTPSSNPISTLYRSVVCDKFIFTAPYQKLEYEKMKDNWIVAETELWPPYSFNEIKRNVPQSTNFPHNIGILSSGMALREHLKHPSEYDKKDFLAEYALVNAVKKLVEEGVTKEPLIYLHPLEKSKKEYLEFSMNYYRAVFNDKVSFAPFEKPSKQSFGLCSIGVSVYSSTQTERLFGGYKTLFAPMGQLKSFFPPGAFEQISAQSYEELKALVIRLQQISDEQFFEEYKLKEYRWDAYSYYTDSRKQIK